MPPHAICNAYKNYQKLEDSALDKDLEIVDFKRGLSDIQKKKIVPVEIIPASLIAQAQELFTGSTYQDPIQERRGADSTPIPEQCTVYEHKDFVGQYRTLKTD
jgi:hypothetical protein